MTNTEYILRSLKKKEIAKVSLYSGETPITSFVSVSPVAISDWIIQGSVLNNDAICIIMYHSETLKTIIRYFTDEVKANEFVISTLESDHNVPEKSSDEASGSR